MNLKEFDLAFLSETVKNIAGFDEAGRGPICGPVVAAGVVLKDDFFDPRIDDSKKISHSTRESLYELIIANAKSYSIIFIGPSEIDRINILEASRRAMTLALEKMLGHSQRIDLVLTDYMQIEGHGAKVISLKKGDATSFSIACASILAKVSRDRYMCSLAKDYPLYELDKHKGYPTPRHLELIEKYGIIEDIYRKSFKPVQKILEAREII